MTFYEGPPLIEEGIALCHFSLEAILAAPMSQDYAGEIIKWANLATYSDNMLYFSVARLDRLVGQIFLHDWDRQTARSLVGYHLFHVSDRGQGMGTLALGLLQRYVSENTDLEELVAITTDDNLASRGVGRRNGFNEIGASREDPLHGVVMKWP